MALRHGRRRFLRGSLGLGGVALLAGCGLAPAAPGRIYRVGLLSLEPLEGSPYLEAFRQGLRELGYVEGRNVVLLEPRFEDPPRDQILLASELVQLNVDVIVVVWGSAFSARNAASTIPIVFTTVADPLSTGIPPLVASLGRPGRNVTGLTTLSGGLTGKRFELLRATAPQVARIGVLLGRSTGEGVGPHQLALSEMSRAARTLGLQLKLLPVFEPADFARAFALMRSDPVDALVTLGDFLTLQQRGEIAAFAWANRLPAMYDFREFADAGGLLAYGPNVASLCRRAATFVDKILRGTSPADLPVEQPTAFEFVINLKTAQALGLAIPQSVLQQATEIIH